MQDFDRNVAAERRREERRKRARRKNLIILVETFIIFVLTVALILVSIGYFDLKNNTVPSDDTTSDVSGTASADSTQSGSSDVANSSDAASSGPTDEQLAMMAEVDKWYLKLVNPDTSVSKDFISSVERSTIREKYTSGAESSKYLDKRIIEPFEQMCKAAADDGVTLISVSAYRSYNYQNTLYKNRVERCKREEGLDDEAAKKKAATIVAVPGTSEHHLGLAVDINSVETSFENTAAFRWLQKHAADYGFIMRYAEDKQAITKIIYEPWHYRYVGVEHAKAMGELGMCMEEYIDYLKSGGVKK